MEQRLPLPPPLPSTTAILPAAPSEPPAPSVIDALGVRELLGILDAVCRARGVTRDEVCGRRRTKNVSLARHELWWHLRNHPHMRMSYQEIGRLFERDHSSVLHGVRSYAEWRISAVAPPLDFMGILGGAEPANE